MITGKTKTGYEFSIDERIKKDWRFMKIVQKIDGAKSTADSQIEGFCELLGILFEDNGQSLLEHIMSMNDGFVEVDKLALEISDILTYDETVKK